MTNEPTHFNINDFSNPSQTKNLISLRDAHVPKGTTFIRLTETDDSGEPQKSSVGGIKHSKPVLFKASAGKLHLKTTIVFKITPVDDTPVDGIAFFITRSLNFHEDGHHGNFGIYDPQSGEAPGLFAVVFGTFKYPWRKYDQFIAIDVQSRKSEANTSVDKSVLVGHDVTAVITYDETDKNINVHVDGLPEDVTYHYDLSGVLGNEVYVGISSSTGDHVALHDILSWSFDSYIS